jgi:tetratricopeptide (TPR) repeat protein
MVGRITFLVFLFLSIPLFAIELKINPVGIKDLSNYMVKDFTFSEALENLFILEDTDALSFIYFQAFKKDLTIEALKEIADGVNNKALRNDLIFEIFQEAKKRNAIDEFQNVFKEGVSAPIKLLIAIEKKDFQSKFVDDAYNAFINAYKHALNGRYNDAITILEPYSNRFPHTYVIYLIKSNELEKAYDYISENRLKDSYLVNLVKFLKKDCTDILSNYEYDGYLFEILKLECSYQNGIDYRPPSIKTLVSERLMGDDFTIFRLFKTNKILQHEFIYPYFLNYYYRWKLLTYVTFLESYVNDIDNFNKRLKTFFDEYSEIESMYNKTFSKYELNVEKDLRVKFIDIKKLVDNVKSFDNIKSPNGDIIDLKRRLAKSFDESKKQLFKQYSLFLDKLTYEENRLNLEKEFRKLDLAISQMKQGNIEELLRLYEENENLLERSKNVEVSFSEKCLYNKIYLLWHIYLSEKLTDEKTRVTKLNELIAVIRTFMKLYPASNNNNIYLILAEAYEHLGENKLALEHYFNYINKEKSKDISARVYLKIGDILFDEKLYKEARDYYYKAVKSNDLYSFVASYKIGWTYYLEENYEEALKLLLSESILASKEISEPLINETIELIAKVFYKRGRWEDLEEYFKIFNTFPFPERVYKSLGDLYVSLAEYDKALNVYEKGLRLYYLNYYSPSLLVSKIELLTLLGKVKNSYNEKVRFNELFNKDSNYYSKFKIIPQEYGDIVLSSAFYFNNEYEKFKKTNDFKLTEKLYLDYLNAPLKDKKTGEVSFLLAQLYYSEGLLDKAGKYYEDAYLNGFKEEESLYGHIVCLYGLWERAVVMGDVLSIKIETFIKTFPSSVKTLKMYLLLSFVNLKMGYVEKALSIVEDKINHSSNEEIETIIDFLKEKFQIIENKERVAQISNSAYEKTGNKKYLEFKHYALFVYAQNFETKNDLEKAKITYELIVNDTIKTAYTEPALYNLAIIENRLGRSKRALELMKHVSESQLIKKASEFVYNVGLETNNYFFAGEAAEKLGVLNNDNTMFFKSIRLYLSAGMNDSAFRVISKLQEKELEGEDFKKLQVCKALYSYYIKDYATAINIFSDIVKTRNHKLFDEEVINVLSDLIKNSIYILPDDEAMDFIEGFIDICSVKYKEEGDLKYLYNVGDILIDLNTFFLNSKEAFEKGKKVLKIVLKESVEKERIEITTQIIKKIRSIGELLKPFVVPTIDVEKEIIESFGL